MGGGAMVAQLTLDQKVAGSNPARPAISPAPTQQIVASESLTSPYLILLHYRENMATLNRAIQQISNTMVRSSNGCGVR